MMTDESRAELRRGVGDVVRAAQAGGIVLLSHLMESQKDQESLSIAGFPLAQVGIHRPANGPLQPLQKLTSAQILAISVLIGEPVAAITAALADYLIESEHEYATACYERGRADAREQERREREERTRAAWENVINGRVTVNGSDWADTVLTLSGNTQSNQSDEDER